MAYIGISVNRTNPAYTIADFTFWMPQFKAYMQTEEGQTAFNNLYEIANNSIYKSIFGVDWKLAMSLCIAHYLQLIANQLQAPAGDSLEGIAGGGSIKGLISSASVGGFSKSYDTKLTVSEEQEALFRNQTAYGAELYTLIIKHNTPLIAVITSGPIVKPGGNNNG